MHSLLFTAHVHMNCPTLPRFIRFSLSLNHFLPEKGLFILESEPLKQCISANRSKLVLEDCERPTRRMLWKWVSQHRLFNLGTSACLGLNISDSTQPLGMFECDVSLPVLWWRCSGNTLYGASQWRVTVVRGLVAVKKNIYHQWKRYNTPREGPCSYPYEGKQPKTSCVPCLHKIFLTSSETWHVLFTDIHTLLGNAHGMPCAFPFKYNNQWYSECTTEGREDHLLWCSATSRYDKGERWGFCPVQGKPDTDAPVQERKTSHHRPLLLRAHVIFVTLPLCLSVFICLFFHSFRLWALLGVKPGVARMLPVQPVHYPNLESGAVYLPGPRWKFAQHHQPGRAQVYQRYRTC